MKKLFVAFLVFNLFIIGVKALEETSDLESNNVVVNREKVKLIKCEDAISSWVELDGKKTRIRLITTDISDGELNDEIDNYVCNSLKNAKEISIERDPAYNGLDDYNRLNVWVYVDGKLLQSDLIEKGYAQVNYVKGDYLYLSDLCSIQKDALAKELGIWKYPNQEEKYCKSGINLETHTSNKVEEEKIEEKDYTFLYDMIGIIVLMIFLSLAIRFK